MSVFMECMEASGGGYNKTRDETRRGQSSGSSVVLRPLQVAGLSFEGAGKPAQD